MTPFEDSLATTLLVWHFWSDNLFGTVRLVFLVLCRRNGFVVQSFRSFNWRLYAALLLKAVMPTAFWPCLSPVFCALSSSHLFFLRSIRPPGSIFSDRCHRLKTTGLKTCAMCAAAGEWCRDCVAALLGEPDADGHGGSFDSFSAVARCEQNSIPCISVDFAQLAAAQVPLYPCIGEPRNTVPQSVANCWWSYIVR